jgi:CelD/BcsL family acetyltransferase involved in cellulose biosynthesis
MEAVPAMKVRVITSLREFDALEPVWRQVTEARPYRSPFLTHDWFACCWRMAGPSVKREVWVVEDAAGPVALVPLVVGRTRLHTLPVRMMRVLDWPDAPVVDVPVAGDVDAAVASFLDAARTRGGWDVLSIPKLAVGSRARRALDATLPTRFRWTVTAQGRAPYVTIAGTWKEFLRSRTPLHGGRDELRDEVTSGVRVALEEHRSVDPDSPAFAEFVELSRESWDPERGIATPGTDRFFRELTARASARGGCRLWILRVGERAVATEYQLGENGHLYTLRADAETHCTDLRPGPSLGTRVLRELFERGDVSEYTFGAAPAADREHWATGAHETETLHVYAATPYGTLLHAIETRPLLSLRGAANGTPRCA